MRGTIGGGFVVQVAEAAVTAPLASKRLLAVLEQLHHDFACFIVANDGALRACATRCLHRLHRVVGTPTLLTIARFVATGVAVVDQGIDIAVGHDKKKT